MLVRCCDCDLGCCEPNPKRISNCDSFYIKGNMRYRYDLVEKLQRAVLDRLLDPKNVAKGEFRKDTFHLLSEGVRGEYHELFNAVQDYIHDNGDRKENARRIIEECGDVAAYLAALIDAVSGVENEG